MDNLNNIPNAGNWGDAASKLNDNFNKVKQALTTVENVSKNNKGYFSSLSALNTAFPSPKAGQTAYVYGEASSTKYYIYNAVNGAWVTSSVEAPAVGVNIAEYTKSGGSSKTTKQVEDDIVQLAGDVNQKTSIDLLEHTTIIHNKYLKLDGVEGGLTNYDTTDYIAVEEGDEIIYTGYSLAVGACLVAYDSNKNMISVPIVGGEYKTNIKLTIGSGISYIRASSTNEFHETRPANFVLSRVLTTNEIKADLVQLESVVNKRTSIDLLENTTIRHNIVLTLDGTDSGFTNYDTTDYIAVGEGDEIIYTGYCRVNEACLVTYDSNKDMVSVPIVGGGYKTNIKLTIGSGISYIRASSTNEFHETRPANFVLLKVLDLNPLVGDVEYSTAVINEMTPVLLSLRTEAGGTLEERAITRFSSDMYLSNIGDYVEIKCSCPEYEQGNSQNICMFVGTLTNGGLYRDSFYFRSRANSTEPADYRIWSFPIGFDPKILHTYKLQIVDDGVGGELWELFVDGLSWGTKSFSINANISILNGNTSSPSYVTRYDYEYVNLKSIGEEKHFTTSELFLLSENAKILVALQNTRLDVAETLAEDAYSMVINIGNIYANDLYYSSYNRKFESDGVKSSTYLDKPYLIESEGDYFEIKTRYYGDMEEYHDKLSLVTGTIPNSRFGWLTLSEFGFRPYGKDYIIWDLSASGIDLFEWNIYRLEVVSGGVELFINGISMGAKPLVLTGYKIDAIASGNAHPDYVQKYDVKYFKAVSQIDGEINIDTLAIYGGSENVELLMSEEEGGVFTPNPLCFVSYDNSAKEFNVYTRDEENQNTYYGFLIGLQTSRGNPRDPIEYSHAWRLYSGAIYTYNKQMNVMTPTGITTVATGESECVFMHSDPNGSKVDHTGGVHGDETIDITIGDFAKFYLDGVPLTELELLESFTMRACSEFKYIQKSSIHDTAYYENNVDTELAATGAGDLTLKSDTGTFAIDGVDTGIPAYAQNTVFASTQAIIDDGITLSVSGANTWVLSRIRRVYNDHPVVASHLKKSVMKGGKFHTENTLIFNNTRKLTYWYAGIYCLGKGVATIGYNENYEDVEFTGSGGSFLNNNNDGDYRLFEAYNPDTGGSAIVKSWITDEGGVLDDNNCEMSIWDRVKDSKYYRSTGSFAPIIGERMTAVTEVEYNKRSD